MKTFSWSMLLLSLLFFVPVWGFPAYQNRADDLNKNVVRPITNDSETTLAVDPVILERQNAEARKDSIARETNKWVIYFEEKNMSIEDVVQAMLLMNAEEISKKSIELYETKIKTIKKTVDNQFTDRTLLNDNLLNDHFIRFELTYESALKKIEEWKIEKPKQESWWEKYWMYVGGAGLITFMTGLPLALQIAAKQKVKNVIKKQEADMRRQAESELRRQLLEDDSNIININ